MGQNTKSLKINTILNTIRTFMSLVFPLITFPYASRVLTPVGIGKVNFATSVVSYFGMIASLGITTYGIREAAKVRDNRTELSELSSELFSINLVSTVVAYALLFVSIISFSKLFQYRKVLVICSATILFTTLGMEWLYSAVEDFLYITIRSIAFQIFSLILLFVFVRNEDCYLQYAAVSVFSNVGSNLLNFFHSRKYISLRVRLSSTLKRHLKPILVLFGLAVASSIYTMLDSTMLGFLKNDWEVGIYSAATKINRMTLNLVVSVSTVILPRLSYYYGSKDKSSFNKLANKSINLILTIAVPCVVGLTILSKQVIYVLSGSAYENAIPVMKIMDPIIIIVGISNFTGVQLFMPMGKEKWTLYSDIIGASINFILNFLLIPYYGAFGAAIGSLAAETCVTLTQLILARNLIDIKLILKLLLQYLLGAFIMGLTINTLSKLFSNNLLALIVLVPLGALIYFIYLVLVKNEFAFFVVNNIKQRTLSLRTKRK